MENLNFTAIDFETATGYRHSACAVGIVNVKNGKIASEYYSLIQPPENQYWSQNIAIHGISPRDTKQTGLFPEIYKEIKKHIQGKVIIAHNESFDRSVLKKTMEYYRLDYSELNLPEKWECTCKIYRDKGFSPASLDACCRRMKVELKHHEALSDARGCAKLYLLHHGGSKKTENKAATLSKTKTVNPIIMAAKPKTTIAKPRTVKVKPKEKKT